MSHRETKTKRGGMLRATLMFNIFNLGLAMS